MNPKPLQWVALAAFAAALGLLYLSNRRMAAELPGLRDENRELRAAKAGLHQVVAEKTRRENDELARLNKEAAELPGLQDEAQRLRAEKQELNRQVQQARAQAQRAQAQAQDASSQLQTAQRQMEALRASAAQAAQAAKEAQAALAAQRAAQTQTAKQTRPANAPTLDTAAATGACINNLRRISRAQQQWALENQNATSVSPALSDLASYLLNEVPTCPAGGTYTLNATGLPTCSHPGHTLPR